MFPPNHTTYIKSLYKSILIEGSLFFDNRARVFIRDRARKIFSDYKSCEDIERVKYKIREGRKRLHRIEQANRGNQKSALKVLEEVYGRTGKARHTLLYPYLNCFKPADFKVPEPFVPHVPHTAPPPPICPPLRAIIEQDLQKKIIPELPIPAYKPLHPGRKANLLWKHYSMLLDRVQLPLPFHILCELELKAGATQSNPLHVGKQITGGPIWQDFYMNTPSVDMMLHLAPKIKSVHAYKHLKKPQLKSPYVTTKESKITDDPVVPYSLRQKRRIYRRLLLDVPMINMFEPNTLWAENIKFNIFKSHWVPQGVTEILKDVPDEETVKSTLFLGKSSKSKKKKKTVT